MFWSFIIGLFFVMVYVVAWKEILLIFSSSVDIIETAGKYIGWVIAVPLIGCIPFMIDGIMIGALKVKLLRNTVFAATVLFFASFYALSPFFGNDALWIAFLLFLFIRGLLLYFCSNKLNANEIMQDTSHN